MPNPSLGNDVVDLTEARALRKSEDERFLRRVFSEAEQELISSSPDPELTLWKLWAAKESGYKALKQTDQKAFFSPRQWQIEWTSPNRGLASHRDFHCELEWTEGEAEPSGHSYVHCLAAPPGLSSRHIRIATLPLKDEFVLTKKERESASSFPSLAGRSLARSLAHSFWPGVQLEVVRPPLAKGGLGPPRYCSDAPGWDRVALSLSHDGVFVAAALGFRADWPSPLKAIKEIPRRSDR